MSDLITLVYNSLEVDIMSSMDFGKFEHTIRKGNSPKYLIRVL